MKVASSTRWWARRRLWSFNTHHNGDRCWGKQVFAVTEIVADRGCAARFESFTPAEAETFGQTSPPEHLSDLQAELAPFDFSGVVLTPPTHVIDGDRSFPLGDLKVDLLHVGPAHTERDLIVPVPEEGVVLMGNVLHRRCTRVPDPTLVLGPGSYSAGWRWGSVRREPWESTARRLSAARLAHLGER